MNLKFINRENNGRLILIFAGWSTDPSFYTDVQLKGWDTLVVWDYSDFDFTEKVLEDYHTIALFAWSLGVYAASRVLPFDKIALAVAVNGTEHPVNDSFGIPSSIYEGTADSLNERNLTKFWKRMASERYAEIADKFTTPDIDHLRNELRNISSHYASAKNEDRPTSWHHVFISTQDKIFPPDSQLRAWESHRNHPVVAKLESPHYVELHKIVKSLLPGKEKIGARFEKSHVTYDSQATAQNHIAGELMKATTNLIGEKKLSRVAEIGAGTGFFTKLFCQHFSPAEMDIVDLYPLPPFNFSTKENYYVADGEEWIGQKIKGEAGTYDAVVASSAIQWFSNPERFIRNVSKLLKPDGFVAFSTFLPGNLAELRSINPYGLPYRRQEELEKMVKKKFHSIFFSTEKIQLEFNNGRDLLRHIKHTGVGGTATTELPLRELLRRLPRTLTYHPFYIVGVRPKQNE